MQEKKTKNGTRGRPRVFDREKALESALRLFWRKSYEQVSIAELCKEMKINPPSLYSAFQSKSALFTEALHFYRSKYWQPIWDDLDSESNVFTGIQAFFEAAIDNLLRHQYAKGCLVVQVSTAMPEDKAIQDMILDMREQNAQRFRRRLKQAIQDKQLDASTDIETITRIYCTLMDGMAVQARAGQSDAALKSHIEYAKFLLNNP